MRITTSNLLYGLPRVTTQNKIFDFKTYFIYITALTQNYLKTNFSEIKCVLKLLITVCSNLERHVKLEFCFECNN